VDEDSPAFLRSRNCKRLLGRYGGSLLRLHAGATDPRDLEGRVAAFLGIGPGWHADCSSRRPSAELTP
jgi:hypothetical protein